MLGTGGARPLLAILGVLLIASGCRVHIVGDSTAALVQYEAGVLGYSMTGSPVPGCGYGAFPGERIKPHHIGLPDPPSYPVCVLDWNASIPDDPGDVIIAFVSIHDAHCSTSEGCLPFDTAAYAAAHADLEAMGHPVFWVEVPPFGPPLMQDRIDGLNAAVAAELGCTLEPAALRVAEMYDGLHYTSKGARLVGARTALLAELGTPC